MHIADYIAIGFLIASMLLAGKFSRDITRRLNEKLGRGP
jgi:hypothetical protein